MEDTYKNFFELSREKQEGIDFKIMVAETPEKSIIFVAPHGGKIEKGTSKVATQSANDVFCLYLFEGQMAEKNMDLHITSHNFDEPKALELVSKCDAVIGVHGRKNCGDPDTIFLGGLDVNLINLIKTELCDAGFKTKSDGHKFPANHQKNICNRGRSRRGAQIELPFSLREHLLRDSGAMESLTGVLHRAACKFK